MDLILGLVFRLGFRNPFISQRPREFYGSHFLGYILVFVYTICHHVEILISCTIPSGSPFFTQGLYSFGESFSHQEKRMDFHWRLRDSKSSQVSRSLLSILAILDNDVVRMVSTDPLIAKSSSPFTNPYQVCQS